MHPRILALFTWFFILLIVTGCNRGATSTDRGTEPEEAPTVAATADSAVEYPEPALAQDESPLAGDKTAPSVLVVASRQSIADLAAFLKTTPETLSYVNPRLADPVDPGTLVVIPPVYLSAGETLSAISEKTGLPEEMLQSVNLSIDPNQPIASGTLLAVPSVYIVPETTALGSAAASLGTNSESLLSANPNLAGDADIMAGSVLVVPPPEQE